MDRRDFLHEYYGSHMQQLDTLFYAVYGLLTAVMKKFNVVKRPLDQQIIGAALGFDVLLLLLNLFYRPIYHRWRTVLVFLFHFMLTSLRAALVYSMASEQAIHWRGSSGSLVSSSKNSAPVFFLSILASSGGLIRQVELLGLQQPFHLHVVVSIYFVAVQSVGALAGFRLAYCNALFFSVHEVYDSMAAVVDTITDSLVPLPTSRQGTCSSCPGPIIYMTSLMMFGVVVPLYTSYHLEKAAMLRCKQRAALAATASAANATEQLHPHELGQQQQQQQQQQQPQMLAGQQADTGNLKAQLAQAAEAADDGNGLRGTVASWALHCVLLCCLLLLSWHLSAAVAHVLLPRVLTRSQLDRWCPNRPVVPYLIANQVYDEYVD